jgi:hypothetical protein
LPGIQEPGAKKTLDVLFEGLADIVTVFFKEELKASKNI